MKACMHVCVPIIWLYDVISLFLVMFFSNFNVFSCSTKYFFWKKKEFVWTQVRAVHTSCQHSFVSHYFSSFFDCMWSKSHELTVKTHVHTCVVFGMTEAAAVVSVAWKKGSINKLSSTISLWHASIFPRKIITFQNIKRHNVTTVKIKHPPRPNN